jgi:hypothetical protein
VDRYGFSASIRHRLAHCYTAAALLVNILLPGKNCIQATLVKTTTGDLFIKIKLEIKKKISR